MDPRDHLGPLADGLPCTVCNEPIPVDRIRLLARREDLTFVQVECPCCGSTALEFVADAQPAGSTVAAQPVAAQPVITADDVFAMHEFLVGWQGDFRTLFSTGAGAAPPSDRGPLA